MTRGLGAVDRLRRRGEPVPESRLVEVELRASHAQVATTEAVLTAA